MELVKTVFTSLLCLQTSTQQKITTVLSIHRNQSNQSLNIAPKSIGYNNIQNFVTLLGENKQVRLIIKLPPLEVYQRQRQYLGQIRKFYSLPISTFFIHYKVSSLYLVDPLTERTLFFFLTPLLIKDKLIKAFHASPIKKPVNRLSSRQPLSDRSSRLTRTFPAVKCFENDDKRAITAPMKAHRMSMMTI